MIAGYSDRTGWEKPCHVFLSPSISFFFACFTSRSSRRSRLFLYGRVAIESGGSGPSSNVSSLRDQAG